MNPSDPVPRRGRVVVTGATGLLGTAVVGRLLGEGREVTALVRDPMKAAYQFPAHPGLTVVTADVQRPETYRGTLPGAAAVIHTAAYFREYYLPDADLSRLFATNVDAVTTLLREAVAAGVPAVVQTSSVNTLGRGTAAEPADESAGPPQDWERNAYRASKVRAEAAIRAFARDPRYAGRIRVPIVLPGWMWGPADAGPTSAGRLFLAVARRGVRAVPRAGNHVVDARDVAYALVRAADRGEHLRRYIVAGRWHSLAVTCAAVARATGVPAPREVPSRAAIAFATVLEARARLRGTPPLATREGVRALLDGDRTRITSARAQRELGVTFRPLNETLADTAAWYHRAGLLDHVVPKESAA
ncbi:NAD-dependent epimerase/dehydratase family protein [Streptomyces yaizuensis]|uniref:NAD-dependent epimerase/dehydratase family protein n=1 Tax=Streptomyces yaizuensis TaxID=2989713 RepID=A0ABQ5P2M3_9ACTN|nr:NAD-dependent epimerase/dehydratase family protein [Streptomyces sp. YSPA8]GLF96725.1 NAD-dependent epimerase/dehydratase family protein [Streptomyces sp. YSPA8]